MMSSRNHRHGSARRSRGFSLVELLIALVVISVGALALIRSLAGSADADAGARMRVAAGMYAQQKMEELRGRDTADPDLSAGRHPGSDFDSLGVTRVWLRYYNVASMAAPIADLRKVTVVVRWHYNTWDSIQTVSYVR